MTIIKKTMLWIAAVALVVILVFCGALLYGRFTMMSDFKVDNPEMPLGPLPLTLTNSGETAPGQMLRVDTGSSVNLISREYLEQLKAMGMKVDSSTVLTYVKTVAGGSRIATKRYRVDYPVYSYQIDATPTKQGVVKWKIDTTNRVNTLRDVDFVLVSGKETPRMGRPFIKRFLMEYIKDLRSVVFHKDLPEDYVELCDLHRGFAMFYEPPVYVDLSVNEEDHQFCVNTAMPRVALLEPAKMAREIDGKHVYGDTIESIYGSFPTVIAYDTWVQMGDRAGNSVCCYTDYGTRKFAVNPFNFHTQNAVYDLKNCKVYIQRYSRKERQLRENDVFAMVDED